MHRRRSSEERPAPDGPMPRAPVADEPLAALTRTSKVPTVEPAADEMPLACAGQALCVMGNRGSLDRAASGPGLELVSEAEVLATWPMLPARDLRRARRRGEVRHFDFPVGPYYTTVDVAEFIIRRYARCLSRRDEPLTIEPPPAFRSESGTSISPIPSEAASGTSAAMTPQLAECVARAFARRISRRPNERSGSLSQPPPQGPAARPTPDA